MASTDSRGIGSASNAETRAVIRILAVATIPAAIILLYAGALTAPFFFDDTTSILLNPTVRTPWPPSALLVGTRPLLNASYAVTYQISGDSPWGHRLGNIALHIANSLLVYLWIVLTLRLPRFAGWHRAAHWIAVTGGLLFAIHPLQTEVVTYISGRAESLAAFFVLSSVVSVAVAVRAGDGSHAAAVARVVSVVAVVCGMLSKESGAIAPVLLLAYETVATARTPGDTLRRHPVMYLALTAGWLVPAWTLLRHSEYADTAGFGFSQGAYGISALQYAYTQPSVILHYLRLAFLPFGQTFDYDWPVVSTAFDATVIVPAIILSAIVAAAFYLRRRAPLVAFAVLWFFIALAPTSSIVPLADVAAERRLYLPLAAVTLLMALALALAAGRSRATAWIAVLLFVATAGGYGVLTWQRNALWRDPVALWRDSVAHAPWNPRAHVNLGIRYWERGDLQHARAELETAIALVDRRQSAQAIPRHAAFAAVHLAQVCLELGDGAAAAAAYREAVARGAQAYETLHPLLQRVQRDLQRTGAITNGG